MLCLIIVIHSISLFVYLLVYQTLEVHLNLKLLWQICLLLLLLLYLEDILLHLCTVTGWQLYNNQLLNKKERKESWLIECASSYSVNTHDMVNFKLQMWHHWILYWEEMCIISFCESVWANSSNHSKCLYTFRIITSFC